MTLVDCFIPLLTQIHQFQRQPCEDVLQLSIQLETAIERARGAARDGGHNEADIEGALFAVVAWADEVILAADWSGKAEWQRHLLQRRYCGVSNAGVGFYTRLEALQDDQLALRAVFFLCLGLGFSGRYGFERNQKALAEIRRTNLEMLLQGQDGFTSAVGKLLFPDGYGVALGPRPSRALRRRWRLSSLTFNALLIPLLVLLLLFGIYQTIIWQSVNTLLDQIKI